MALLGYMSSFLFPDVKSRNHISRTTKAKNHPSIMTFTFVQELELMALKHIPLGRLCMISKVALERCANTMHCMN